MLDLVINSSVTHSLMLVLPIAFAALLRWAKCPGWGVIGGIAAGILLGPVILGGIAPDKYEQFFVGGVEERSAYDDLVAANGAEMLAAQTTRRDPEIIDDLRHKHGRSEAPLRAEWQQACWSFQRPFRSYTTAVVALTLLGSGLLSIPSRTRKPGMLAPISIGLWSAALPGALAATYMYTTHRSPGSLWLVVAAVAIGPWLLTRSDRDAADGAEHGGGHLVQTAGRIASIVAIAAAGYGAWLIRGLEGLAWCSVLLALPLGWLLPRLAEPDPDAPPAGGPPPARKVISVLLHYAFVPSVAACVSMRVEFLDGFGVWALLVFLVLSADARWFGALFGALIPGGRRALRSMRLLLGSMACGPTQLAVLAVVINLDAFDTPVALGLLIGAAMIEFTGPARRTLARQIAGTEEEIEHFRDELE